MLSKIIRMPTQCIDFGVCKVIFVKIGNIFEELQTFLYSIVSMYSHCRGQFQHHRKGEELGSLVDLLVMLASACQAKSFLICHCEYRAGWQLLTLFW